MGRAPAPSLLPRTVVVITIDDAAAVAAVLPNEDNEDTAPHFPFKIEPSSEPVPCHPALYRSMTAAEADYVKYTVEPPQMPL